MQSSSDVKELRVVVHQNANGLLSRVGALGARHPGKAIAVLLGAGMLMGAGGGVVANAQLRTEVEHAHVQLEEARRTAQVEVNALAARVGELQAQANRLNALGERLTRLGQLEDGEFDFGLDVGVGGAGEAEDMPKGKLVEHLEDLDQQLDGSGEQLSVLESLLSDQQLMMASVPSGKPIDSYITSHYGYRADPFRGGRKFHAGIDFEADVGDPVNAVAAGVISYSGNRSGYGYTVEIDHGNGYMTRYAHNSRLIRKVGEPVRAGQQIAKAGSTGRSTGAHVHFEVWRNGKTVNPYHFLRQRPVLAG